MAAHFTGASDVFPLIEILNTTIVDRTDNKKIAGMAGNNFSSYVRDYDFSILLPDYNRNQPTFRIPHDFGSLHGNLFQYFIRSETYRENFRKSPVICLSVSTNKSYYRTGNRHPVLGVEYHQPEFSLTDQYFQKMGLQVRYFMPPASVAPLAFYFSGDLLSDYTPLELISTISTMETFQKIYRPEIYNANAAAPEDFHPSLKHEDYSLTRVVYDREERSRLAVAQGQFTEDSFIKPYHASLEQWSASYGA